MTLVLNLEPDLEIAIQREAHRNGVDETDLVVAALRDRFGRAAQSPPHLSQADTALLLRINAIVPETIWNEYDVLVTKRNAETLTTEDHARLIELSDEIERIHFARIRAAAELAVIRGVSLDRIMDELGIRPRQAVGAD
jgi:hypothetical protein